MHKSSRPFTQADLFPSFSFGQLAGHAKVSLFRPNQSLFFPFLQQISELLNVLRVKFCTYSFTLADLGQKDCVLWSRSVIS